MYHFLFILFVMRHESVCFKHGGNRIMADCGMKRRVRVTPDSLCSENEKLIPRGGKEKHYFCSPEREMK